jgi:hypothetical protein
MAHMYTSKQRDMDRLRSSSVPHDYDPMYASLSADSRADTAFGMPPTAFPGQDPSINLAGRAEKMEPMQTTPLPNRCICGSYSMAVGRNAPGLQVAAPTEKLKATDSWGVPVRVGRDGAVKSRDKKGSSRAGSASSRGGSSRGSDSTAFGVAGKNEPHACLMIAYSALKGQESTAGQGGGCYMALSRYNVRPCLPVCLDASSTPAGSVSLALCSSLSVVIRGVGGTGRVQVHG